MNTVSREEADQQLSHTKLQHVEGQRRLLHQLHRERQRLQEQRGIWEKCRAQSEQEKLRCEEEQARIFSQFSSEKKRMEEQHKEEVSSLQAVIHTSHLQLSQSEASVEELRARCVQVEDDLKASGSRCSELEARLTEACSQLEESITFLDSQELLNQGLASEKSTVEEELQLLKIQEEQLLLQVSQLREELGNVQAVSESLLQEGEVVADNCSHLSNAVSREQTVTSLRAELEALKEATRSKAAELDSLKTDRDRLIQDQKDQAMAVDTLQLELDGVSEELDRRRSTKEALQEALKAEQTRSSQLRAGLDEEKEEVCRLLQENGSYTRLADQLSNQIVEMEEEISTLRDHLREVSSQLNETADLVLALRTQLNTKTSEVERLWASSEKLHGDVQQLSSQLEAKAGELDRAGHRVLQLQEVLLDSQNQLRTAKEHFEQEKRRMTQQLMELETLVLALEEAMDPSSPHRFVEHETDSENQNLVRMLTNLRPPPRFKLSAHLTSLFPQVETANGMKHPQCTAAHQV